MKFKSVTHLTQAVTILILMVLLAVVSCTSGVDDTDTRVKMLGFSPERLARIDAYFEQNIENDSLPGAVALIVRHGEVAYFKSFGTADMESGTPMERDAIFRITSMSIPITSVAMMMLYEEGHFLLGDPVSAFIPEFEDPQVLIELNPDDTTYTTEPANREITVRDLLTHTSGIGTGFFQEELRPIYAKAGISDAFYLQDVRLADKIPRLAGLPLLHHPGEGFTYGLSTDVLGYLVEVISGMPLDEFLEERLFEPLGMRDTHFYLPDEKEDRLVPLYRPTERGYERHTRESMQTTWPNSSPDYPVEGEKTYFSGGSGLVSTATDYARFLQMLLNGGSLDGSQILSPKSVELMTVDHVDVGADYGLGFFLRKDIKEGELGSAGQFSFSGGFGTTAWVDPMEEMIGIFMSQAFPPAFRFVQFRVMAYQAITGPGQPSSGAD
jgi:CubicO group peptidase (beta-lactamase class C family)